MSTRARTSWNRLAATACAILAMASGACGALIGIPDREAAPDGGAGEAGASETGGDPSEGGADARAPTGLASLVTSRGTLTPAFTPATHDYSVAISDLFGDLPFTMTATAARDGASIAIDGQPVASGAPSGPFSFAGLRARAIPIVVSSPLGSTERYDVDVTNAPGYTYFKPLNETPLGQFGLAIALSGDTVVVGEPGESGASTGTHGDPRNTTAGSATGAVWVFVRGSGGWVLQAYLKASVHSSSFGFSVALSNDTLVVGALDEDFVDGNTTMYGAGGAYVFTRNGTTWTEQAHLRASNPHGNAEFGSSVAIDGDTVAIGSKLEPSLSAGVDQSQTPDPSAPGAGAVYVFVRNGMIWSQQAYVKPSNTPAQRVLAFGECVALSGDTLAVGAPAESSSAKGINGSQNDTSAPSSGAVYVFTRAQGAWSQQAYVKASNTRGALGSTTFGAAFGGSIALDGDVLAVGSKYESSNASGIGGTQTDVSATRAGAVYLFSRAGAQWTQDAYVKASNTRAYASFGTSVALWHDRLAVGAEGESSPSTAANGDQGDGHLESAGAAYLFERGPAGWTQRAYVKASNTRARSYFGGAVALHGEVLAVGAPFESSNATGIDGDQSNSNLPDGGEGAVYVIE